MTVWGQKLVAQIPNWPKIRVMDQSFDPGHSFGFFFSFSTSNQELLDAPVIVCQLLVTSPAGRLCKGHTLLSVVGDTWEATPSVDSVCWYVWSLCWVCDLFFVSCVHSHFYLACYQSPTCPVTPLSGSHSVLGPESFVCHFDGIIGWPSGTFCHPLEPSKGLFHFKVALLLRFVSFPTSDPEINGFMFQGNVWF